MIESVMYFGIGFLVAALLGLLFLPLVHNRAVRLTMKRLEASTPLSIAESRADEAIGRIRRPVATGGQSACRDCGVTCPGRSLEGQRCRLRRRGSRSRASPRSRTR